MKIRVYRISDKEVYIKDKNYIAKFLLDSSGFVYITIDESNGFLGLRTECSCNVYKSTITNGFLRGFQFNQNILNRNHSIKIELISKEGVISKFRILRLFDNTRLILLASNYGRLDIIEK